MELMDSTKTMWHSHLGPAQKNGLETDSQKAYMELSKVNIIGIVYLCE